MFSLVAVATLTLPLGTQAAPTTLAAPPAVAAVEIDAAARARVDGLADVLNGASDFDAVFAPVFRKEVSRTKWDSVTSQLRARLGQAQGIASVTPATRWSAYVRVAFERGFANIQIAVDPAAPHQVTGLLVTGTEAKDDSPAALEQAFAALPGQAGYGIFALDDGEPRLIAGHAADRVAPIGSAFKLWVLAELQRQVSAGRRRWADVVPLGARSLPSGITQTWPEHAPVTLQTLATLMIAISDNTAADTLLMLLGRDAVDRTAVASGSRSTQTVPVLTTREAFALKSAANASLRTRWIAADAEGRRRLLDANAAALAATAIDPAQFDGQPLAPDTVEWFASPADQARTLDWLRRHGDPTTRAILSVNGNVDPPTAARFAYVGGKGGSEPGVIALDYLVRTTEGRWYAVTGNWHRTDGGVDALAFRGLMIRALLLALRPGPG